MGIHTLELNGPPTADLIADLLVTSAKQRMQAGEGPPPPSVMAYANNELVMVMMSFDSDEGKRQALKAAWAKFLPLNPEFIIMIMDCYTKTGIGDPSMDLDQPISLANLKQSGDNSVQEALIVTIYPKGSKCYMKVFPYTKDAAGQFVFQEPKELTQDGEDVKIVDNLGPKEWTKEGNDKIKFDRLMRNAGKHSSTIH